jgi:hypothetical protein
MSFCFEFGGFGMLLCVELSSSVVSSQLGRVQPCFLLDLSTLPKYVLVLNLVSFGDL